MPVKTINDTNLSGQRVLVRCDFNVPLEKTNEHRYVVTEDTRIQAALPTVRHLLDQGARVILCSHLGRPKGQPEERYSLRPVGEHLSHLLGQPVPFARDCIGTEAQAISDDLQDGHIALLENLRFHDGETKNDSDFAKQLASIAAAYVNDAFGTAHRAHASTVGVTHHLSPSVAGLLMEKELHFLREELAEPKRPFVVILGGAKVSDKIGVIEALLDKADAILIGGAMAYTFALAEGKAIGDSLSEPDKVEVAKSALEKSRQKGVKFLLPVDNYIVNELDFDNRKVSGGRYIGENESIPDGAEGVDIGPATIQRYQQEIANAGTIVWNGPMGVFEIDECARGTFAIAEAVADANATSIIGGGDSVSAVKKAGVADRITFISTGGGASLELLEGKELPGVAALDQR